jgi:hypothetical protein
MHYLILIALFISTSAHAEFGFDDGIRKPQSMMVAGNSVIDDEVDNYKEEIIYEDSGEDGMEPITDQIEKPIMPIEPTSPSAPVATRKVFKKITPVKSQRSIADDRIDDSYVQELIKNNFNFQNK